MWSKNFRRNKRSHYAIQGSDLPLPMTRFRLKSRPIFPGVSRARAARSYQGDKGRHEHVATLCPDVRGGSRTKVLWIGLPEEAFLHVSPRMLFKKKNHHSDNDEVWQQDAAEVVEQA